MSKAKTQKQDNKAAIVKVKNETVDIVASKIRQFQNNGEIHFPANYSPDNALKSAWLILQETVDRNKQPVLAVCTKPSIANALLNMVVQGLNSEKKQCYFIAYGKTLVCQRSYFGTVAVTKRVVKAKDIVAQVVYADDEFEYQIKGSRICVTKHIQSLENVKNSEVVAAYCTIEFGNDRDDFTTMMTIEQLKNAWKQSQMKPIDEKGNIKANSTHDKFTADMAIKTAMSHTCKYYMNTSDDESLEMKAFKMSDEEASEAMLEVEIEEEANKGEVLDVDFDKETGEVINGEAGSKSSSPFGEQKEEPEQQKLAEKKGPGF